MLYDIAMSVFVLAVVAALYGHWRLYCALERRLNILNRRLDDMMDTVVPELPPAAPRAREHYREAERLISPGEYDEAGDAALLTRDIALAQVHATLALAAGPRKFPDHLYNFPPTAARLRREGVLPSIED